MRFPIGHDAGEQGIELGVMGVDHGVAQLVDDDIINQALRDLDQLEV